MSKLIRFHDWLINPDEISDSEIKRKSKKKYCLILTMKCGQKYSLICGSQFDAQVELDNLTCITEAKSVGHMWNHFLSRKMDFIAEEISNVRISVNKLLKSYSIAENRIIKKEIS